jgi:hypothetical protein
MPRIEKVMLLIAGVSLAAGAVIAFGHRNDSPEKKGQLTAEQRAELAPMHAAPPQLQVAPQTVPELVVLPAQTDGGSVQPQGGEESGAEDGSGS